ncbi:cytochrome P450 [Gordonia sp. (in: high G+C Gram-positive bacteria)]|uniref:cytochrome P450 n=1 Tax=Gordonia sp. (in: high G+C Gram-positive bacteria) TaxID=84139 RepID=UPI0016A14FCA|nr:cytochrome P450 [Gordonia sp. (in: high G+C Gram-positive bacteria)]NLG47673.1 cytochrome P450 [Gordonia sp. (in: high G+C Gram-positive bacteria)]
MTRVNGDCPMGPGWDFTDPDLLERGIPTDEFAWLRETAPVWFNQQPAGSVFGDDGYWVISRHRDIRAVSKDSQVWSTNANGAIMRLPDFITADQLDFTKALLINHDPPAHTRLRKVISRLFTPRAVGQLHDNLTAVARRVVTAAAEKDGGNFVEDIAVDLPLTAIFDLLGVPAGDRAQLFEWSNVIINTDDPSFQGVDVAGANASLLGYAYEMAEQRRQCPTDDIVTTLIEADIDGEAIDQTEFGFFVLLLVVAGNETTRNAITHGMNAFFDHPEQWELFKRERPVTTADEIVRWATPVNCFQRTALQDTEIDGVAIAEGQRVGLFYGSANYDETVFDDPFAFNILRDPNPHLGFGGNGAHFCIGANLAKMEIGIMMNAIADIVPDIAKRGDPVRMRSGWLNGVKDLQVGYR